MIADKSDKLAKVTDFVADCYTESVDAIKRETEYENMGFRPVAYGSKAPNEFMIIVGGDKYIIRVLPIDAAPPVDVKWAPA